MTDRYAKTRPSLWRGWSVGCPWEDWAGPLGQMSKGLRAMLRRVNFILKSLGATEGKGVSGSGNGEVGGDSGGMGGRGDGETY